jgi:hypothetical protein
MDAHVCVRKGVEKDLFIATVIYYVFFYPNICPMFVWDSPMLLFGPIFRKTNSGNGRQIKNPINIQFR